MLVFYNSHFLGVRIIFSLSWPKKSCQRIKRIHSLRTSNYFSCSKNNNNTLKSFQKITKLLKEQKNWSILLETVVIHRQGSILTIFFVRLIDLFSTFITTYPFQICFILLTCFWFVRNSLGPFLIFFRKS